MTSRSAGILGCGHRVPRGVRRNDDPIFAGLDTSRNAQGIYQSVLFRGLDRRHVLGPDESITGFVTESCGQALERAEVTPEQVDRIYGYITVPEYNSPNELYQVHHDLGLPRTAMVVPINAEFTPFLLGVIQAAEAIAAGRATYCLVACGTNMTRHIDYTQGHSTSMGDAAAAAVVGPSDRFVLTDYATLTDSAYQRAITIGLNPLTLQRRQFWPIDHTTGMPAPTLDMTQTGIELLGSLYKDSIPKIVHELLERNGIPASDITLITHQGVRLLLDHWAERIRPARYVETLSSLGNLLTCTYPVNLSVAFDDIDTAHVVIVGLGTGAHVTALLLRT